MGKAAERANISLLFHKQTAPILPMQGFLKHLLLILVPYFFYLL